MNPHFIQRCGFSGLEVRTCIEKTTQAFAEGLVNRWLSTYRLLRIRYIQLGMSSAALWSWPPSTWLFPTFWQALLRLVAHTHRQYLLPSSGFDVHERRHGFPLGLGAPLVKELRRGNSPAHSQVLTCLWTWTRDMEEKKARTRCYILRLRTLEPPPPPAKLGSFGSIRTRTGNPGAVLVVHVTLTLPTTKPLFYLSVRYFFALLVLLVVCWWCGGMILANGGADSMELDVDSRLDLCQWIWKKM